MGRGLMTLAFALASIVIFEGVSEGQEFDLPDSLNVRSLSLKAQLQTNGALEVEQKITYFVPTKLEWQIFTKVSGLTITADGQTLKRKETNRTWRDNRLYLTSRQTRATSWVVKYQTASALIRTNQQDRLFLKILQESGFSVEEVTVDVRLSESSQSSGLFGNVYAIHGASNLKTEVISPNQIRYSANFLGPEAIFTVNANWPKTVFRLQWPQELRLFMLNLDILLWLMAGLLLPAFSLVVLLRLLYKQRRTEEVVRSALDVPPSNLAPVLVGVLVNKKIYPEEIVAMFVDLCQRGYLVVVKKDGRYYFGQRKLFDENLTTWEAQLLKQIFPATNTRLTEENLRSLTRESLYNSEVRSAFSSIYGVITQLRYFSENPHLTRVKYKLVALLFYFVSGAGLAWTAITGSSPYLLIPLMGSLLISYLIIRLSPKLIRYTREGISARRAWLAFANYLALPSPVPLADSLNQTFGRYLPYAIALHRTLAWAKRFDNAQTILARPDWFISFEEDSNSAEEYLKDIDHFTRTISKLITAMRGPLVA